MAFFMYLQLSFSMSWWVRMVCLSSSSTTMPGPWVHGPPRNIMIRAPVLGKVHCHRHKWFKWRSRHDGKEQGGYMLSWLTIKTTNTTFFCNLYNRVLPSCKDQHWTYLLQQCLRKSTDHHRDSYFPCKSKIANRNYPWQSSYCWN